MVGNSTEIRKIKKNLLEDAAYDKNRSHLRHQIPRLLRQLQQQQILQDFSTSEIEIQAIFKYLTNLLLPLINGEDFSYMNILWNLILFFISLKGLYNSSQDNLFSIWAARFLNLRLSLRSRQIFLSSNPRLNRIKQNIVMDPGKKFDGAFFPQEDLAYF